MEETAQQLADHFGLSRYTIYKWTQRGILPPPHGYGRLARYFYGIDYPTRDLRLGLIEASAGEIGSPVDAVLLFCYHYDPMTGTYGLAIFRVLQVAGALTVFGLGTFIVVMLRWERQGKLSQQQQQP